MSSVGVYKMASFLFIALPMAAKGWKLIMPKKVSHMM